MQAFALADIEINYEVERIRAWRFRKVSEYMRRLNKDGLFSETACRERFNALTEGTARIPTNMDDEPEARLMELEAYRTAREEARNKEQAIKDRKEALERKTKEDAKIKNAQKAEEIAQKREQKEKEKAQRAMQRAAAAQVRSQRATENSNARRAHNEKMQKQEAARAKKAAKGKSKGRAKEQENVAPKRAANKSSDLIAFTNAQVTDDTPDPRGFLSLKDLAELCADRGITTSRKGKGQLLSELQDADDEWSAEDLKTMCRPQNLNVTGTKRTMKYHLARKAAEAYPSFRAGVEAAQNDEMEE
jgi:DNA polymerase III alpha subunit (gram-positive type)